MSPDFAVLVARVEASLQEELPGMAAQAAMAPRPRRGWPAGFDPARIRSAAGLLLLFPIAGRAHVVLTIRADTLGRHGGQVSLPGGVIEPGETFEQAALREAHEEVGLNAGAARVLGALTPLDIPISGFRLHTVVAASLSRPLLRPAHGEVAAILEVAVAELMAPGCLALMEQRRDGRIVAAPSFCVGSHAIWGATAMILAEFLGLLGWEAQLS